MSIGRLIALVGVAALSTTAVLAGDKPVQPVKDDHGRCQAMVPQGLLVIPGLAQGPNKAYSVVVEWEDEAFKPLGPGDLELFHYSKAFENSATRVWAEKEANTMTAGNRSWHVYVPAGAGRCHCGIGFKTGAPEDVLKAVAITLTALSK